MENIPPEFLEAVLSVLSRTENSKKIHQKIANAFDKTIMDFNGPDELKQFFYNQIKTCIKNHQFNKITIIFDKILRPNCFCQSCLKNLNETFHFLDINYKLPVEKLEPLLKYYAERVHGSFIEKFLTNTITSQEEKDCCICTEKIAKKSQLIQLKCSHSEYFHYDCLLEWFIGTKERKGCSTCPLCKMEQHVLPEINLTNSDLPIDDESCHCDINDKKSPGKEKPELQNLTV